MGSARTVTESTLLRFLLHHGCLSSPSGNSLSPSPCWLISETWKRSFQQLFGRKIPYERDFWRSWGSPLAGKWSVVSGDMGIMGAQQSLLGGFPMESFIYFIFFGLSCFLARNPSPCISSPSTAPQTTSPQAAVTLGERLSAGDAPLQTEALQQAHEFWLQCVSSSASPAVSSWEAKKADAGCELGMVAIPRAELGDCMPRW